MHGGPGTPELPRLPRLCLCCLACLCCARAAFAAFAAFASPLLRLPRFRCAILPHAAVPRYTRCCGVLVLSVCLEALTLARNRALRVRAQKLFRLSKAAVLYGRILDRYQTRIDINFGMLTVSPRRLHTPHKNAQYSPCIPQGASWDNILSTTASVARD